MSSVDVSLLSDFEAIVDISENAIRHFFDIEKPLDMEFFLLHHHTIDSMSEEMAEEIMHNARVDQFYKLIKNKDEMYNTLEEYFDVEEIADEENMEVDEYLESPHALEFFAGILGLNYNADNDTFSLKQDDIFEEIIIYIARELNYLLHEYVGALCEAIGEMAVSLGADDYDINQSKKSLSQYVEITKIDETLTIRISDHDKPIQYGYDDIDVNIDLGFEKTLEVLKPKIIKFLQQ